MQKVNLVAYNCQLRVLIVDADPVQRDEITRRLEQQEFTVFCAWGIGPQELLDDAQHIVMARHCHVAVVMPAPLSLIDPAAYLDHLTERLNPAGIVIFAPEADDQLAFQTGRRGYEYVRQNEPLSDLAAAVEAQGRRFCQCTLDVRWPEASKDFARTTAETLKMEPHNVIIDDLYDLLGRAFRQAVEVDLKALPSFETEISPVRRAMVLWASEKSSLTHTRRIPKAIKIGSSAMIRREMQNYHNYVDGWLFQNRQARLEDATLLWHLGAIVYAFLGASPEEMGTFRHFYQHSTPAQTLVVLRHLFTDTCRNWYKEERGQLQNVRLFDLYNKRLKLEERLARLDTTSPTITIDGYPNSLPNPAQWVAEVGIALVFDEVTTCITHGDLHADNFFVDQANIAWLIDFEQTGPAHALRDFIELEADIMLRLTPFAGDALPQLAALVKSLMSGATLTAMWTPTPEVAANPALYKTFQVIAGLRHLAHITTGVTDLREYLNALLYEALFMATLRGLNPEVQRRGLFVAALIVKALTPTTSIANGRPPVPHLTMQPLQTGANPRFMAVMEPHKRHLRACYQAGMLQTTLYGNSIAVPHELATGLALIRAEAIQTQRIHEALARQ